MTSSRFIFVFLVWLLVFSVGTTNALAAQDRELADSPQFVSVGITPNIVFMLDDSGSMRWGFMPDDLVKRFASGTDLGARDCNYSGVKSGGNYLDYADASDACALDPTDREYLVSPHLNKVYFNPALTYSPPLKPDGTAYPDADFDWAKWNGYDTTTCTSTNDLCIDLDDDYRALMDPYQYWGRAGSGDGYRNRKGFTISPDAEGGDAFYYVFNNAAGCGADPYQDACYDYHEVDDDQEQNFANWFSYYRTREMAARAGVSAAFHEQGEALRIGYGTINNSSLTRGVRDFSGTDRVDFFQWLNDEAATGSTPLRTALQRVGEYYKGDQPWLTDPTNDSSEKLSCRQSYAVLTTDGYWGGDSPGVGDVDGDGYSNTLADVARKYWKDDLRGDLDDNVPASAKNPADWQHMVSFTVGLGVIGTLDPEVAFTKDPGDTDYWTKPSSADTHKIDDLLHAAVNSHGNFFSASDPDTFSKALSNVLKDIVARSDATTSVALASPRLVSGFLNYRAEFDSDNWKGDVVGLDPLDGSIQGRASDELPAVNSRKIFTLNPGNGTGVAFNTSLPAAIKARMMAEADSDWEVDPLINFLRGDESLEGDTFRERASRLGDIVNSRVVFSGRGNEGWGAVNNDYLTYIGEDKNDPRYCEGVPGPCKYKRKDTIFVGANDGMLHAFDARTLEEFFAYVPSTVHDKLYKLADPDYGHEFYVDGQTAVGDAYIGGSWGTYLVGTLGAGGRGVFALDVTDPENFSASDVLWELTAEDLGDGNWNNPELGHTFSDPVITRLENGTWVAIFGNGYNSNSGQARLFVVDLKDGTVLQRLPLGDVPGTSELANGLSGVESWPTSGTFVKRIYAGDLNGTMWRVDFNSSTATIPTGMQNGLFTDPSGRAITSTPTLGNHPAGGVMVYFGTGKFFEVGDKGDGTLQTAYAIRDKNAAVASSELAKNTLAAPVVIDGIPTRQVNATGPGVGGWSIDLTVGGTEKGERVLIKPELKFGKLTFASYEPVDDACTPGGAQRIFLVDAISGGGSTREIGFGAPMAPPVAIKPPGTTPTPPGDVEDPGLYDPNNPSPVFPTPPGADGNDDRAEWCSRIGIPPLSEGDSFLAIGVLCEGRQSWREAR